MATTEFTMPETFTMHAAILSGARRGEIAEIVMGADGSFINTCENPPNFVPEVAEAVFTDDIFRGRNTTLTLAFDGSVMKATEPFFSPEEQEVLDALDEASKRAEATAIRAGETARRISEKMRRSTAELQADTN